MKIISHRGYWQNENEKNSKEAFVRSFELGFGTETDIRDLNGKLVIAHDPPVEQSGILTVTEFLQLYKKYGDGLLLALNIKADGLYKSLISLIDTYKISNYFVFDMSIPDTLGYINNNVKFYSRQSEYELEPAFYSQADGIWLDEFNTHWIQQDCIKSHILSGKNVCIVSPELHKRDYSKEWSDYKKISHKYSEDKIILCTDIPERAKQFFYEN